MGIQIDPCEILRVFTLSLIVPSNINNSSSSNLTIKSRKLGMAAEVIPQYLYNTLHTEFCRMES